MIKDNFLKILGLLFFSVLIASCTKYVYLDNPDDDEFVDINPGETIPPVADKDDQDSLKYLMYQIMEKSLLDGGRDTKNFLPLYFWYKDVPDIDPWSATYKDAQSLLDKIMTYPRGDDGSAIDRYTFLDDGTVVGEIGGAAGDIGIDIGFALKEQNGNLAYPVVRAVDKNSPAGQSGVKRGWLINKINNSDAGIKITSDGYLDTTDPALMADWNAVYNDAQASFQFLTINDQVIEKTLVKADYQLNPILFDTVYNNIGGKKVGYFVFNTFSDVYNNYDDEGNPTGGGTLTKSELDRVFNKFASAGISDLIVDLRYNGGGAVTTAEYICNYIAPSSATGKLMFTQNFNDRINAEFDPSDLATNFGSTGKLGNLDHVFFFGTGSTASASEIVINNLKPYMDVHLIGSTTYGKPVGSLVTPISIFKNGSEKFLAYLLPIAFDFENSRGEGHYYYGMTPDAEAEDNFFLNWGDTNDENIAEAFNYIKNGTFNGRRIGDRFGRTPGVALKTRERVKRQPTFRYNGTLETRNKFDKLIK